MIRPVGLLFLVSAIAAFAQTPCEPLKSLVLPKTTNHNRCTNHCGRVPCASWPRTKRGRGIQNTSHLLPDHRHFEAHRDGKVDRTRPLCPYPQVAAYNGSGSTNDAANFSCKSLPRN